MKVNKIRIREQLLIPQLQPGVNLAFKQQLKALRQELLELLTRQRFVSFVRQPNYYYDTRMNCLWLLYGFKAAPDEMFRYVSKLQIYAFKQWEVPTLEELKEISREPLFQNYEKLQDPMVLSSIVARGGEGYWTLTLGTGSLSVTDEAHTIIPIHRVAQRDILTFILEHALLPKGMPEVEDKLKQLYALTVRNSRREGRTQPPPPSMRAVQQHFLELDYNRARLPVLEPAYLNDMEKGLWELYQPTPPEGDGWVEVPLEESWEARNPEIDIRSGVVAIDFGTSSTVVACRELGKTFLLRVGMSDFFQRPTPEDYQNPTILEFINLPNLLAAWQTDAYQPLTRWEDFHFSHEALGRFRANEADQRIVASMLTSIKQWPLTFGNNKPLRIADQASGFELELRNQPVPMPIRGEPIRVSEEDPFDPIELYAYYLGLFINHRANGLFLEYYMTFPVTYPRAVKQQILASFARGLQRSLPPGLLSSSRMTDFSVREEASEPAAYAACALAELGIEATASGVAYAVFDFGGGSTDFDFGIYRLPSEEEENNGYEKVIEHFGASGDTYLGGENLVNNLVYQLFQHNLEVCREHRIPFSRPPEGERFPGDELFIDHSQVAQTNSALLMAKVRPIWEEFLWTVRGDEKTPAGTAGKRTRRLSDVIGDALANAIGTSEFQIQTDSASCRMQDRKPTKLTIELLNRDRQKVAVVFSQDRFQLNKFLVQRVGMGLIRFFIAMRQAFEGRRHHPEEIHILLAGNASRSILVQSLFAAVLQDRVFGWEPPTDPLPANPVMEELRQSIPFMRFVVHRPPVGDPHNPYKPNAKTGVAIGLLKLIPGESLLAITPTAETIAGEAPFRFFVGRLRKGRFQPVLRQNGPYLQWEELGIPTRGVFVLMYSTSPQAGLGLLQRGTSELLERNLRFPKGNDNKRLFIRATGPATVEICLADSQDQVIRRPEEASFRELVTLN